MAEHSPHPWKAVAAHDTWFIDDANGQSIFLIARSSTVYETPEPGVRITRDVPRPHADANAALLVEAPALLAAAIAAVEDAERSLAITTFPDDHPIAKLKASIERALRVVDGAAAAAAERARRDAEIEALFPKAPELLP